MNPPRGLLPGRRRGAPWRSGWARTAALALSGLSVLTGCTSAPAAHPAETSPAGGPALAAIQATIDAINVTAGGPVGGQRAVLQSLAAPDQAADQRACPAASTTLAFDPAYRGMRASGDDYLLPVYITIYTGDRISGSDLATLRLRLIGGAARTSALCVS